jgi:phage recombination protein Bet
MTNHTETIAAFIAERTPIGSTYRRRPRVPAWGVALSTKDEDTMTQELTTTRYENAPLAPVVTNEQLDLVRRTVAMDATPAELDLYMYDCQRHGVHPLDRLLHFTKRKGKYTPITSIDLFRSRAADTGELGGIEDPQFRGDATSQDFTASVTVYRFVQGQRCPFTATARWSEYKPDGGQNGGGDTMWRKMPYLMLGKCAEALALRKAFPRQLAGMYAQEEMEQAGNALPPITHAPAMAPEKPASAQRVIPQASYTNAPQCDVCGTPGRKSQKGTGYYCPNKQAHNGAWYTIPEPAAIEEGSTSDEWDDIDASQSAR